MDEKTVVRYNDVARLLRYPCCRPWKSPRRRLSARGVAHAVPVMPTTFFALLRKAHEAYFILWRRPLKPLPFVVVSPSLLHQSSRAVLPLRARCRNRGSVCRTPLPQPQLVLGLSPVTIPPVCRLCVPGQRLRAPARTDPSSRQR